MDSDSDGPVSGADAENDDERAGLYLAWLMALAVPALIVLAFVLSSTGSASDNTASQTPGSGLDRLDADQASDDVSVVVAGAGESQDEVTTEIGSAASLEANEDSAAGSANSDDAGETPADNAPSVTTATSNDEEASASPDEPTVPTTTATDDADRTTTSTTSSTITSSTITTSTTSTTTTSSTTTSTTTTTTTAPDPDEEPAEFAQRIDIGRIGETTLQFRFSSATSTSYVVTVRSGSTVVVTKSGGAQASVLVNETVQGLTPGTDYTVQVTLNGPSAASSPQVAFRTSGGAEPEPAEESVAIQGLRLADVGSTRFQVNYESNICANGSFVIREQGGATIGSNAGQAAGCTTRHLGIPGFWTPALQPNTTYVITVTVEANGAGQGNGNTASQSLTVTTNS